MDLDRRVKLHEKLEELVENVYFQPPPGLQMEYPCIIYKRDDAVARHADNSLYSYRTRYQVTIVARDPEFAETVPVRHMQYAEFARFYVADGLNHDVFNLFF